MQYTPQPLAFVISVGSMPQALTVDGDTISKEEVVGFIVEEKIGPVGLSTGPASEKKGQLKLNHSLYSITLAKRILV